MRRRGLHLLGTAVALSVLAGCGVPDFGMPHGATEQGQKIFGLWQGSVVAALAVGAVVWALIFFTIFHFRRRHRDDTSEPSQAQYNIPLEVAYTFLPLVIVAVLFYFTVRTETDVTKVSAHPDVKVEVTAFQWGWRFHYTGTNITVTTQGIDDRPTLTLPAGETTQITLVSTDVIHNFYVPDFLFKRDATPGLTQVFDITPVHTGSYLGRCAEFCGLRHAQMLFDVSVVSAGDYRQWLSSREAQPS